MVRTSPPAPPSHLALKTTWGTIEVDVQGARVTACRLPHQADAAPGPFRILGETLRASGAADRAVLDRALQFLRALLTGRKAKPPRCALPAEATDFQRSVWHVMADIPWGTSLTYAGLGDRAGYPRSARAVGQVCGGNRIPLFIPCHRVLASGGGLGGFSGGLAWKKLLLELERQRPAGAT